MKKEWQQMEYWACTFGGKLAVATLNVDVKTLQKKIEKTLKTF